MPGWMPGHKKILVTILASLQRCSGKKVQAIWVSNVCSCHGGAAIIGPEVPLPHHSGGGTLVNAHCSSLPHAQS